MNVPASVRTESTSLHSGPNPGLVATVFAGLFLASLVPVMLLVGKLPFPSPLQPPPEALAYVRAGSETDKIRLCAFLQFGSAVPLGIFTATMASRLRHPGATAAGVSIALFGGLAASFFMALSALLRWTIAQPDVTTDGPLTLALHFLIFAAGGPGYSVPLGLLVAGISVVAGFMRLLPRWLIVFGVILSITGELSALSLLLPKAQWLIPLTRFPGFIWLIAAGFKLPGSQPLHKETEPQQRHTRSPLRLATRSFPTAKIGSPMRAVTARSLFRWFHLLLSIPIIGYIYGPVAEIPRAAFATKFVFVPLVVLSGIWMWKGHAIKKLLSPSRRG